MAGRADELVRRRRTPRWESLLQVVAAASILVLAAFVSMQSGTAFLDGVARGYVFLALFHLGLVLALVLIIEGSRSRLAGFAELAACSLVGTLLLSLNMWSLYLGSTGLGRPTLAAVDEGRWGWIRSAMGFRRTSQEFVPHTGSIVWSLCGVFLVAVLVASPWIVHHRALQRVVVFFAALTPVGALVVLPGFEPLALHLERGVSAPGSLAGYAGVVGVAVWVGVGLRIASGIEWIRVCTIPARSLAAWISTRWLVSLLVAKVGFVCAGVAGILPWWLGGNLEAFDVIRSTPAGSWAMLVGLALLAGQWLVGSEPGISSEDRVAGFSLLAASPILLAEGLAALCTLALMLVVGLGPTMSQSRVLSIVVVSIAFALIWAVLVRRRANDPFPRLRMALAVIAGLTAVLVVSALWPASVIAPTSADPLDGFAQRALLRVADTGLALVVTIGVGLVLAAVARLIDRVVMKPKSDGAPAAARMTRPSLVVTPIVVWSTGIGLLVLLEVLRSGHGLEVGVGLLARRGTIPDPVAVDLAATLTWVFVFLRRPTGRLRVAAITIGVALSVLAFAPYFVADILRVEWISAVVLVVPIAAAVLEARRSRRLDSTSWVLGAALLALLLLAFARTAGARLPLLLTAPFVAPIDHAVGPAAHFRSLLLVPLCFAIGAARRSDQSLDAGVSSSSSGDELNTVLLQTSYLAGNTDDITGPLRRSLETMSQREVEALAHGLAVFQIGLCVSGCSVPAALIVRPRPRWRLWVELLVRSASSRFERRPGREQWLGKHLADLVLAAVLKRRPECWNCNAVIEQTLLQWVWSCRDPTVWLFVWAVGDCCRDLDPDDSAMGDPEVVDRSSNLIRRLHWLVPELDLLELHERLNWAPELVVARKSMVHRAAALTERISAPNAARAVGALSLAIVASTLGRRRRTPRRRYVRHRPPAKRY